VQLLTHIKQQDLKSCKQICNSIIGMIDGKPVLTDKRCVSSDNSSKSRSASCYA